ncbi:MAG: dipeptidase [Myxococcales bacterium]|nr:dipeptidase [Myxococcales bacterium]MCB9709014.1 dipeptidase [Myxococcales bacterium]
MASENLEEKARRLHAEYPAIDLHADSLLWSRWVGYDLNKRHRPPLPWSFGGGHVDVPRLIEGGLGSQFFGLVALPALDDNPEEICHAHIDRLEQAVQQSQGLLRRVQTVEDILSLRRGEIGALVGIEGAHCLRGRIEALERFAARGVRYLGLCHLTRNACGAPAIGLGMDPGQGLTNFGRKVLECCQDHGVLVDLAHLNKRGFLDACGMARAPVIVSHTGVSGVHALRRNIDDEQLRAVAKAGGVVGVIFCPAYLGNDGVEAVVDHLFHIIKIAGEDTPALGSDWDGFIRPTRGLEDASKLPDLTQALVRRGLGETSVAKILRKNVLRVLTDVPPR